VITQELLDRLWDFSDPAASELRFAAEAASEPHTDAERAELRTQQARALGLQERFDAGRDLLDSLGQSTDPAVRTRVRLEAGRLLKSSGNPDAAVHQFEEAAALAEAAALPFLQVDALHMLAIADKARSGEWAAQAIDRAQSAPDDRTRRWLISLYNNLGWSYFDAGDLDQAMAAFLQAQDWAERLGSDQQRVWASEAIEECAAAQRERDAQ
jgi:tetratricopeptide (TPR) repeat protein